MTTNNYRIIAQNRRARFEYFIETEYEAGLVLQGSEIKSIRNGKVNIQDSHIEFDKNGDLYLLNSYISPYKLATLFNHEPTRKRKLLLKKREINKIISKIKLKGFTCIPLVLYINNKNLAKIKIAIAKGKKLYDKREAIKERDFKREKAFLLKYNK
ncbi:MAG: SsrA-binding protein SmpB [Rickettsiales bacterium]|nr:SsrA-binding protein SmpB [Rickettsiales bacterium]